MGCMRVTGLIINHLLYVSMVRCDAGNAINLVPFIVTKKGLSLRPGTGIFADISPTLLDLMGIEKPSEMTGRSLIAR